MRRETIEKAIRRFDWDGYRLYDCASALDDDDSCHQWVRDLTTSIVTAILEERAADLFGRT